MKVKHILKPIYDENSKVLILGSLPSVKSREIGFYYGHPKNRFWSTLEKVFKEKISNTKEEKITFLKKHHIALFDVVKECDITSSSDASNEYSPQQATGYLPKAMLFLLLKFQI